MTIHEIDWTALEIAIRKARFIREEFPVPCGFPSDIYPQLMDVIRTAITNGGLMAKFSGTVSNLRVVGVEMECPLCGVTVRSGEMHSCTIFDGKVMSCTINGKEIQRPAATKK